MGLMMEPGTVISQLNEMNSQLGNVVSNAEKALCIVGELEETNDSLIGKSYDSIRNYYQTVHIPILQGIILYGEALMGDNNTYAGYISGYLAGIGYVDEDELKRDKEYLEQQINHVYALMSRNKGCFGDYLEGLNRALELVEKKLDQIEDFLGASAGLYEQMSTYMAFLHRGILCIREDHFDMDSATYDISAIRKEWLCDMDKLWDVRSKKRFLECIQTQYGFDDETVRIMGNIYDKLYKKYPDAVQKEIDWRFTRLMGGLFYDDDEIATIKWNDVAGCAVDEIASVDDVGNPTDMTEKGYFTKFLGISEKDYKLLRYQVRLQHAITGKMDRFLMPEDFAKIKSSQLKNLREWRKTCENSTGLTFRNDEEFLQFWNENYNRYEGKGDYAHQQITTAAILVSEIGRSGNLSNIYLLGGDEKVSEYAGWLGDAVLPPLAFGPEDYKADLDAANITSLMEKRNLTYQDAVGQYYLQIENGVSRAELFLQDTDLNYIKEKIYDKLVYPDQKELIANALTVEERILAQERLDDDEYLMRYLKFKVPATYNFIRSLENKTSEMGDYK